MKNVSYAGGASPAWETVFIFLSVFKVPLGGVHAIVPTLALSFLAFVAGVHLGEPVSSDVRRIFWNEE